MVADIPVINPQDLSLEPSAQGDLYASADARLGPNLGLRRLGITYSEVPAGRSGCPFHNHRGEDELFIILSGTGVLRYGHLSRPIGPGDVIGAPAGGPDTAHQIINTGSEPLCYHAISSMAEIDIVEYPDSGKYLAKTADRSFRSIRRHGEDLDYWDGEPGASTGD